MRTIFLVFVITFMAVSTVCAAETASQKEVVRITQEIGRYQLFQGQYTVYDLKRGGQSTTTLFLIDTATGQVRRYVNKVDEDGRYIETWVSTDSSVSEKKK
jgi:S-adenosylmethionine hydrolase